MDASAEFIYFDLEAQAAPEQTPRVPRLEDVANIDAQQFANLRAVNDRLMALPGEDAADAVEIELDAQQINTLLEGRWVP